MRVRVLVSVEHLEKQRLLKLTPRGLVACRFFFVRRCRGFYGRRVGGAEQLDIGRHVQCAIVKSRGVVYYLLHWDALFGWVTELTGSGHRTLFDDSNSGYDEV